jgi:hypothetical protein
MINPISKNITFGSTDFVHLGSKKTNQCGKTDDMWFPLEPTE